MIRSKATWVGEDGKSTEYFCHLKSRSIFNKTIKKKMKLELQVAWVVDIIGFINFFFKFPNALIFMYLSSRTY